MDYHNYYFMQLVVDSDLDDIYADMLTMERTGLRLAHGLCQTPAADGDAHELGGIVKGLLVTKSAAKAASISVGTACDASGRKITLTSAATIPLTNIGQTPVGSLTGAATGVAIAITAAKEAWLSLYIQYGELETDPRVDGDDDTVYFRVSESFRFFIAIGSEATPPALDRAGLSDSYVHLADILLDDAEEIESIDPGGGARDVICYSSADFDYFDGTGRDYSSMHGHRGDWIALDDTTDFPLYTAEEGTFSLRAGTARAAVHDLVKQMQRTTSPSGSLFLGGLAFAGALAAEAEQAYSLSAEAVQIQLQRLLIAVNKKLGRGGGGITGDLGIVGNLDVEGDATLHPNEYGVQIDPLAGTNRGLYVGPGAIVNGYPTFEIGGRLGGGVVPTLKVDRHGLPLLPVFLHDDFLYKPTAAANEWDPDTSSDKWGLRNSGGLGGIITTLLEPGGIIRMATSAGVGEYIGVTSGYSSYGSMGGWNIAIAPWAVALVLFRCHTTTDTIFRAGFEGINTSNLAELVVDMGLGTVTLRLLNSTGGGEGVSTSLGTPLVDVLYAVGIAIGGDNTATIFTPITPGTAGEKTATLTSGTFGDDACAFFAQAESKAGGSGASACCDLDLITIMDSRIPTGAAF